MTTRTAVPCRGRIIEFTDESGTIETEHATRIRFGRSGSSGFEPRVGLEVWIMATRVVPVVGERATLVNLTGAPRFLPNPLTVPQSDVTMRHASASGRAVRGLRDHRVGRSRCG